MAYTAGPSTGNYSRSSILANRRTQSNSPKAERLLDNTAIGGHQATYDPVTLAQRYSNDYQAEIDRRTTLDANDPTISVLNDLRTQKLTGQSPTTSYGETASRSASTTANDYYDKYLQEQQDAINKQTQASIDANNAYIPQINEASDKSLQNAYILREQNKTNAPQALSALGYTGGAAESSLLGINTDYENTRNTVESNRQNSLGEIAQNEAKIRATGDSTLSSAAASYYDKLIAAQAQAEADAQSQANWQAEYDQTDEQLQAAAAQQAWQNAYDEKALAAENAAAVEKSAKKASSSSSSSGSTAASNNSAYYSTADRILSTLSVPSSKTALIKQYNADGRLSDEQAAALLRKYGLM